MCDTNERFVEFFNQNGLKTKEIWYIFDIKTSMKLFDNNGEDKLYIKYPHCDSEFSGYEIVRNEKPLSVIDLEKYL